MTKTEFLTELENALEGKLRADEVSEILADYGDIFDSIIGEGKGGEAAAMELGSPAKIARKILEDSPDRAYEKNNRIMVNTKYIFMENIAVLSKRFGAYIIDNLIGSLILILLISAALIPFSTHEIVTGREGIYTGGSTKVQTGGPLNVMVYGYSAKLYQDKDGLTKKVEVWDSYDKLVFKGSNEEFVLFLDEKSIKYPEDFKSRVYVTTVRVYPIQKSTIIFYLPYFLYFVFLGAGNLFNALILWKFNGFTVGKKIFNIRLQKADDRKLTLGDVLLRELVVKTIGNTATGGLLNIGSFILACITDERKTVHDLAAKTRVLEMKG